MKLQFRIRPTKSLLDLDASRIREALGRLPAVEDLQIYDDRASDATFVTVVLKLSDARPRTLGALRSALLSIPRTRPLVVDSSAKETALRDVVAADLPRFARK